MSDSEESQLPTLVQARITFDPKGDGEPTWYCEVGDLYEEPLVQGDGPTALAAVLNVAERATVLWAQARWPQQTFEVMDKTGRVRLTEDGVMVS